MGAARGGRAAEVKAAGAARREVEATATPVGREVLAATVWEAAAAVWEAAARAGRGRGQRRCVRRGLRR